MNSKEKHIVSHSLRTCFSMPPSVSAFLAPWMFVKHEILRSQVSNRTIALHIAYKTAVTRARASINNSRSFFTACWMIGTALFFMFFWWCANIFISSSSILLQWGYRPSDSRKQLRYSSSSVLSLLSELLRSMLWVAGRSGFVVPFCSESVGFSRAVPAS